MLAKLGNTNVPSSSTTYEISLIVFSTKEKAIARFRCFKEIISALDEELLEVSYFRWELEYCYHGDFSRERDT